MIVLVPLRKDYGRRDRIWTHLKRHHWKNHTVVTGKSPDGPFNRSAAINQAAKQTGWDVAVIADADTWVPDDQLRAAAELAKETGKLTAAFTAVVELTEQCSDAILAGRKFSHNELGIERVRTEPLVTQSSMLVVTKELWDTVGGFDERFIGWSCEDNAFWRSCHLLAGPPNRVDGYAYHLWHPPALRSRSDRNYTNNQSLWRQYRNATNRTQLRKVQQP